MSFNSGLTYVSPIVGGIRFFSMASTTLVMLDTPLAASLCPRFFLTYPMIYGLLGGGLKMHDMAPNLDGLPTVRRPRPMALNIVCLVVTESALGIGRAYDGLLTVCAGKSDFVASAVTISTSGIGTSYPWS